MLVKVGCPLDGRDRQDWTPLMHAADQGHGAATVALLELGADPTLQNETLNTAIDMAWDLEVCTIRLLSGQR